MTDRCMATPQDTRPACFVEARIMISKYTRNEGIDIAINGRSSELDVGTDTTCDTDLWSEVHDSRDQTRCWLTKQLWTTRTE